MLAVVEAEFLGVRLPRDVLKFVEETAKEEGKDKSTAVRELLILGRKKLQEQRAIDLYRQGIISTDKAAEIAGITVVEAMSMLAANGLKSDETVEEYRRGLAILADGR